MHKLGTRNVLGQIVLMHVPENWKAGMAQMNLLKYCSL